MDLNFTAYARMTLKVNFQETWGKLKGTVAFFLLNVKRLYLHLGKFDTIYCCGLIRGPQIFQVPSPPTEGHSGQPKWLDSVP